jgi:PAS domain S-box-containing protein
MSNFLERWRKNTVDPTQQAQIQAALRHREAQLELALEFAHIGTWDWDLTTNQVVWNANHFSLLGLEPNGAEVTYELWRDRVHSEDLQRVKVAINHALHNHTTYEIEYRIIYPDGTLRWVTAKGRGLYDEAGQPLRMMGVLIDVSDCKQTEAEIRQLNQALEEQNFNLEQAVEQRTAELRHLNEKLHAEIIERQRAETALKESEELFRQVFENAPIGIALARPSDYQFVAVNPAFCAMLGYEADELKGEGCPTISYPDDLEQELPYAQQLLNGEIPGYQLIKRYICKNQDIMWGNLTTRTIRNESNEILYLLGLVDDITERKQAQDELTKRTTQLEETNRELESFSYSVSHDLRAPLRHINGFVVALSHQLNQAGVVPDPKVQHYLNVIQDSGKRMSLLIDGLLTLSRVGRRQMERQPVHLTQLATQAIRLVKSTLDPDASVQFVLEQLPIVQGDAALLQQVFTNLIDNAIKFSQHRSPAEITISTLPNGTLFVKDNGVGFSMEYADHLFGAFQRLHSRQEFEGMGIGLAIVQRIIHRHGGKIWAESQPDQGACFYFTLE